MRKLCLALLQKPAILKVFMRLPSWLVRLLYPAPVHNLGGRTLHASMQLLIDPLPHEPPFGIEGLAPEHAETVRGILAVTATDLCYTPPASVRREDHRVPYADGSEGELLIREYIPSGAHDSDKAFLYMHGGGWVIMSVDTHDKTCAYMADKLGMRMYSVDYRLAPEHPFPKPLEDCEQAWKWMLSHTGLKAPDALVGGDSAGGNLAAALCIRLKKKRAKQPGLQALIYPALDSKSSSESVQRYKTGYYLTAKMMDWFWLCYGDKEHGDDPLFSPLQADDKTLAKLAPAVVFSAGFDPLGDEGETYAKRLESAGVPCTHQWYDELLHGFVNMTISPPAKAALDDILATTQQALGRN